MSRLRALLPLALLVTLPTDATAVPAAGTWETSYTAAACGEREPVPVSAGETSLVVAAAATVSANDIVLNVFRNGALLAATDTATSPEAYAALTLDPPAAATDVVEAQVCPYDAASQVSEPLTATGTYAWASAPAAPATPTQPEQSDGKKDVRIRAIDNVLIPWGAPGAAADVTFPEGTYNKAEIVFTDHPDGDAYDRLITVEVDGVEMFRATGPRVDYTVTWDVTPYLSLLSGGTHRVMVRQESYQGRGHWVTLDFVLHQAKTTPPSVADHISAPWNYVPLGPKTGGGCAGNLGDVNLNYNAHIDDTRTFTLPDAGEVRSATFYGYLTPHGCEEFWYSTVRPTPVRQVHLAIDGTPFADFVPKPYTYAFVGGYPEDPIWGPADQAIWNTAQPVLADNGVYTGTGAIPPYTFDVTDIVKHLAPGEHALSIRIDNGNGVWFLSGQVLVSYGKGRPTS